MVAFAPGSEPDFSKPFIEGPHDDEAELASKARRREERRTAKRQAGKRPSRRQRSTKGNNGCLILIALIVLLWTVGQLLLTS